MLRQYSTHAAKPLAKTALHDLHVSLGADMVDFASYSMPVLYKGQTHIESHHWVRQHTGLFDVSHMLQHKLRGKDVIKFLHSITPTDFTALCSFSSQYSTILNEHGGIVDDTIITKHTGDDDFYIVTNAGTRAKILDFFSQESRGLDIGFEQVDSTLLAVQGPTAQAVLQPLVQDDLSQLFFGQSKYIKLTGKFSGVSTAYISRGGYTGEDGFELAIPNEIAVDFAKELLSNPETKPIGLAARDSLRLEAGMCLYGSDLTDDITPVEASLSWVVSKSRRDPQTSKFNGSSTILGQLKDRSLVKRQRVGFVSKGPAPRHGFDIYDKEGAQVIGEVTSGSFSPSSEGRVNVGMGYVNRGFHKSGTELLVDVRGKKRAATVAKLPFITPKYYRG